MNDSRSKIRVRSWALAFAVALSPAFFQSAYSCERGDTYLLELRVEEDGADQIASFNINNREYSIAVNTATVLIHTLARDAGATVTYEWVVNGQTIGVGELGVGGGDATVNVPPGQSTLRVVVRAAPPETAIGIYFIEVDGPEPVVPLTVAMTDNIIATPYILPFNLDVTPTSPITQNQAFTADIGGSVEFPEWFFDYLQAAVPGGIQDMVIVDLQATVQTRGGGATGADVPLAWDDSGHPYECGFSGGSCDPVNDQAGTPGGRPNTDCVPTGNFNPCVRKVAIPISTDCAPGGVCDGVGKLDSQCNSNGFCSTGGLVLPLATVVGASYVAGDGVSPGQTEALFGWVDTPPPSTAVGSPPIDGDGTWNMLPGSSYNDPIGPLGIRMVLGGGLFVSLEGVMGTDSNGPAGVGVPDDASPMPDSALVSFPVEEPAVQCANLTCNFTGTSSTLTSYYVPSPVNPNAVEALPWSGAVNINCEPNGNQCDCTAEFPSVVGPITVPGIGDLCLYPKPVNECPTGTISCEAGTDKNISQTQIHALNNLCGDNPSCRSQCQTHCSDVYGGNRVENSPACEGTCRTADTSLCWPDDYTAPPPPGYVTCGEDDTCDELGFDSGEGGPLQSSGHEGFCGCQCISIGDGDPTGPGEALLHIGYEVEIFFDNDGDGIAELGVGNDGVACTADDEQAPGTLPDVCVPFTTSTASAFLPDAGYFDPNLIYSPIDGTINPPDAFGSPFTCVDGVPSTAVGAVLQGVWTTIDSRRNDFATMLTITCE